ncbi:hypothetical protein HPO96_36935 [Kribbella sandramycini]|uniref:Terminase small subunit n=1 Tax=Kribbella sandramycini TaxID=60450 RepID=A0A7Y4P564_9ACTN|nr:hypothetical protein [Kribbella sandramycini]MBB6564382.1 hypothetical protein [Kribbella sandramycini]NOL45845.1 hypothetical protein [Kribbella sandramycini]
MARGTLNPKKPNSVNRNASAITAPAHVLTDDGLTRGPSLEDATGRDDWDADVRRWYDGWRTAPQAQIFTATDWQRLALLAPLVERYFADPKPATMSEIRLNEERLGATHVDRLRARIAVTNDATPNAAVLSIAPDAEDDSDVLGLL